MNVEDVTAQPSCNETNSTMVRFDSSHGDGDNDGHDSTEKPYPNPPPRKAAKLWLIENVANRQVTFCKRRTSLLKKAYELSILCDAKIGVIVYSPSGRLSQFCSSGTSMVKILERYQRLNTGINLVETRLQQQLQYWRHETFQLQKEVDYLRKIQYKIMGEHEVSLSIDEIEKIESMLEVAQRNLTAKKVQLLQEQNQYSLEKGTLILRENEMLKEKLSELELMVEYATRSITYGSYSDNEVNTNLSLGPIPNNVVGHPMHGCIIVIK